MRETHYLSYSIHAGFCYYLPPPLLNKQDYYETCGLHMPRRFPKKCEVFESVFAPLMCEPWCWANDACWSVHDAGMGRGVCSGVGYTGSGEDTGEATRESEGERMG